MKKFKSFFLAAVVAVVAFGLTSCQNDDVYIADGASYVSISLTSANLRAATGDIEEGRHVTVSLDPTMGAVVFVLNSGGNVIHRQVIPTPTVGIPGETVLQSDGSNLLVAQTSLIYVVANIPTTAERDWLMVEANTPDLPAINARALAIASQTNHEYAVVANLNAAGVAVSTGAPVNVAGTDYTRVNVQVNPVISRMELAGITATREYHLHEGQMRRIVGFNVTGVWLDGTFPEFTYGGSNAGTVRSFGTTNDPLILNAAATAPVSILTPTISTQELNLTTWIATPAATLPIATHSNVWAFNFASGNVPRLIVRFENIQWAAQGDATVNTIAGPRFITVTHYNGSATNPRQRGNIYYIAATDFNIDLNDLGITVTNPEQVYVRVVVQAMPWNLVNTTIGW